MKNLVKKALQLFCERSGFFPAKCSDFQKWREFAENSPRSAVERVYKIWTLSSDFGEENDQNIGYILRCRLHCLENPRLKMNFINAHKDKIVWVRSDWSAEEIFSYMDWEKCLTKYPFYVVDENNQVRGIAVEKDFIFAGALNCATWVDEAEHFYKRGVFKPLTDKDVKLLCSKEKKIRQMMNAAGMQPISGRYLIVGAKESSWCSVRLNEGFSLLPKDSLGGCYLLAKL